MRVLIGVLIAALGCATLASAAALSVSSTSVTTDETGTCTAGADQDTHVDELLATIESGTATDLHVKSQIAANQRTLVRFDLSPCAIPVSATVSSATLRLVLTTAPGSSRTHAVRRVTGGWAETTTWNGRPPVSQGISASATTGTVVGALVSWTVTADVQQWTAGSAVNEGWEVSDGTESAVVPVDTSYAAREHVTSASRPQLFVLWER